jgi:hypothetical protein
MSAAPASAVARDHRLRLPGGIDVIPVTGQVAHIAAGTAGPPGGAG